MAKPFAYAQPVVVDDPADCSFYHCMTIPGVGEVGEQWDLRPVVDRYLGEFDFRGKRVLDVGTASGYLTFELEKRGAEVVSFDMADGRQWDLVPHHPEQPRLDEIRAANARYHRRLQNAYWFTHRRLGSKARAYYGDIYDLPSELGEFDVVFFGMILSHLRDPFQALFSAGRLSRGWVLVTNQAYRASIPGAVFIPDRSNRERMAWWGFSELCLTNMLEVIGFTVRRVVECQAKCVVPGRVQSETCKAFVAERIAGTRCLTSPARVRLDAA